MPRSNANNLDLARGSNLTPFLARHVAMRPIDDVKSYAGTARRHPPEQVAKLEKALRSFGFVVPLLVDTEGTLLDGHAVLTAAQKIGLCEVPVIQIAHLTPKEVKALRLFLNRVPEDTRWEPDALRLEFETVFGGEITFDPDLTGFTMSEIDASLGAAQLAASGASDADDAVLECPEAEDCAVRPGDIWILGPHRLLCANALLDESWARLMWSERAAAVITDPPYNVRIRGHVTTRRDGAAHREFAFASGEMTPAKYTNFLKTIFAHMRRIIQGNGLHYVFMDWRHLGELGEAGRILGRQVNLCVWNKTNAGMGSLYRSKHELIGVFITGDGSPINNVQLGKHGRYRTNVWDYAGANTFRRGRAEDLEDHPTVKPVALLADALLDCTHRGDIVADPFAGSGSLILAADRTGRRARAMEIDPAYVEVAIRRWQDRTGGTAHHAQSDLSFNEVAALRKTGVEPVRHRSRRSSKGDNSK
ncbi:MAG: site-specific DNA-methyltransferase [Minwuia sp.]|uniref:site-specific DNA-methyltransferase n=1 Tax=Minwuia sp. TaxID=2493630 RepID=UPI003A8B747B